MSYLTVAETADRLDVTRQAVLKLIRTGSLPGVPERDRGRVARWLVPASAVNARVQGNETPPGWITLPEAAERLARSPKTVRRYVDSGLLPGYQRPDGAWLINPVDLDTIRLPRRGRPSEEATS